MINTKRLILPLQLILLTLLVGCSGLEGANPTFDENRAFEDLKAQVDIGPRYPGAPGHVQTAKWIQSKLREAQVDGVEVQNFSREIRGKKLEMANIVGYFNPNATRWVLLAAHWDTRPISDQEVDVALINKPVPGANDGASGVAVLIELARMFAKEKPNVGVYMIFLDGEDYGPSSYHMFLGSRYFRENFDKLAVVKDKPIKFEYGILLDMIGDKNLKIYQETNSLAAAPGVVKKVWATAKDLGYSDVFVPEEKYAIDDDHVYLNKAGVKCIDVIDFDYGSWHTVEDTVDKCSPKSLKIVGDVISKVIYSEKGS